MTFKLGKQAAKPSPKRVSVSAFFDIHTPPKTLTRKGINPRPLMLMNDTLGDCTSAGIGNYVRAVCAVNGYTMAINDTQALKFYEDSTGYTPTDISTDRGGIEVDVLAYALIHGYPMAHDVIYPKFATLGELDTRHLALSLEAFDAVYLGVQLAEADQTEGTWDTTTPGDQTPGSWGGHCCVLWGYEGLADDDTIYILTWGKIQRATWRWLASRIDEAHILNIRSIQPPEKYYKWQELEKELYSQAGL